MSNYEIRTGKVKEIKFNDICLEEKINILKENFVFRYCDFEDKEFDCDSLIITQDERVFEIIEQKISDDSDDLLLANQNSDGTIDYILRYYNGGCSFNEAFEDAIEKINSF